MNYLRKLFDVVEFLYNKGLNLKNLFVWYLVFFFMIWFFKFFIECIVNWWLVCLFFLVMVVVLVLVFLLLLVYVQMSMFIVVFVMLFVQDQDVLVNVSVEQMIGCFDCQVNLDCDVELVKVVIIIKFDKVEYCIIQDEVEVIGYVWMQCLQDQYIGDYVEMNMGIGVGYVINLIYLIGKNGGCGKVECIDFLVDDQVKVMQGIYSICEVLDFDWYLCVNIMDFDSGCDIGIMYGGLLYFKDVLILGLFWMMFLLLGECKLGVLLFIIGMISIGGVEILVFYYFNLVFNYDLMLVLKYIVCCGLQMGVEI